MVSRERVLNFGDNGASFGILHETDAANAPLVIFINAGIVHRIGPHRLYVKLARAFADQNVNAFRFDLSGLGDAPAPTLSYEEQALQDIRGVIDHLEALGLTRNGIVLLGLCSGSENAYKAALADERVTSLILLDPHSYPSVKSKLERMASKATDVERVSRKIGQLVGWGDKVEASAADDADVPPAIIDRPDPPRQDWARDLSTLTARGVEIYIRYTRYVEEDLTRSEHFFEAFGDTDLHDLIEVDVDGTADHTYTPLAAQSRLIEACCDWLNKKNLQ